VCAQVPVTILHSVNSQSTTQYSWYKWQQSTDGGSTWTDYTGIISETQNPNLFYASITVVPTLAMDGYQYRLVVANDSNSIANVNNYCYVFGPASSISVKPSPSVDAGADKAICPGDTVNIGGNPAATGGTSPYNYSWNSVSTLSNGGISNPDAFPAANTLYILTVTDFLGCAITDTVAVNVSTPITISGSTINPSCFGYSDGAINISLSGGVPPFTFNWSNGMTTEDISSLSAGVYSVTIADVTLCQTVSASYVLMQPQPLTGSETFTDVSCFGGSDGSITLSVVGGNIPYSYLWNDTATTQNRNLLAAGNYSVTITDARGCEVIRNISLNEPAELIITNTLVPVSCNGGNNGAIDIAVTGGILPYSFNWSNGGITEDIDSLSAGNYMVTVTDSNSCVAIAAIDIVQPTPLSVLFSSDDVSCYGGSNGAVTATVSGGTPAYTYLWSNNETDSSINNLTVGQYDLTVTDANGCVLSSIVNIAQPDSIIVTATMQNLSCYQSNDGSIQLSISGGTVPYQYVWSNISNAQNQLQLPAATYSVTVTDNNGCIKTELYDITQPDILTLQLKGTELICQNTFAGAIQSTVTGGTMPYEYLWNTGSADSSINSFPFGNYILTVTDNNNCIISDSFTIAEYQYIADFNITDAEVCLGESIAVYDISTSDSIIISRNWLWGDGTPDTGINISHEFTAPGTYNVSLVIAMQNGCIDSVSKPVVVRELPNAYAGPDVSICPGETTILAAMGGVYYEWLPNADSMPISPRLNIVAPIDTSIYVVRVSNLYGCVDYDSVQVNIHAVSPLQISNDTLVCPGAEVQLEVSGGVTYQWTPHTDLSCSDCSNPVVFTDAKRQYNVSATDVHGCSLSDSVTVTIAPLPNGISSISDTVCSGATIQLFAEEGHNYLWQPKILLDNHEIYNPVATLETTTTFSLMVTNIFGCSAVDYITVYVHDSINTELTDTVSVCLGNAAQIVGNPQYTYQWTPSTGLSCVACDTTVVNIPESALYIATVASADGCFITDSVFVNIMPLPFVYAGDDMQLCEDDSMRIDAVTYRGTYFTWTPAIGLSNPNILNPVVYATASATYQIEVRDSNGCTNTDAMNIEAANQLGIHLDSMFRICEGQPLVLEADITFISDAGATYIWYPSGLFSNPHANAQFIVPHDDEVITLIVESGNCKPDTQKIIIDVMPVPNVEADAPEHVIAGEQFEITTASFRADTFSWYPEQLISCINNKCSKVHAAINAPTMFTVMVADTNGCMATDSVLVNVILDCGDKIFIPNSFTPNGDETNDRFCVRSLELMGIKTFRVFNRWGEMVFETNDLNQCWDGKFNGTAVNPDVYVYYAEGICTNGKIKMLKGNVTVIR
jgi:gliding motility-associated-like protein